MNGGSNGALLTRIFQIAVTSLLALLSFFAAELWRSGRDVEAKIAEEKLAIDVLSERVKGLSLLNDQRFHDLEHRMEKPQ